MCLCVVLQEAVSTGDPEMVQLVLQRRDYLKASTALGGVPELLSKIREVFSLSLSLSVCSPLWNVFHSSQKTKNCKLKPLFNPPQSPDFYMEMKWEFTSWSKFYLKIPLYNWPCVDVCNVVVYIAFPSFPSPSRFPGLSQWRVSDLEEWGQPACGRHSARLREHDLDQRSSELHFQGRWWVPFSPKWGLHTTVSSWPLF